MKRNVGSDRNSNADIAGYLSIGESGNQQDEVEEQFDGFNVSTSSSPIDAEHQQ